MKDNTSSEIKVICHFTNESIDLKEIIQNAILHYIIKEVEELCQKNS